MLNEITSWPDLGYQSVKTKLESQLVAKCLPASGLPLIIPSVVGITEFMLDELYQKARQGDRHAESAMYRILFERFVLIVKHRLGGATLQECEDIAQEACAVLMERYYHLEQDKDFLSWAYTILRNKIGNAYQRRDTVRKSRELQESESAIATSAQADPLLAKAIRTCFQELAGKNRRYARVINLSLQGHDNTEICQRLSLTTSNLGSMLCRARKQLIECLRRKGISL